MAEKVEIYGKESCPYTRAAKEDYRRRGFEVQYFDVLREKEAMSRFLEFSGGDRQVPLIVDRGRVSIGFDGT